MRSREVELVTMGLERQAINGRQKEPRLCFFSDDNDELRCKKQNKQGIG